MILPKPIPPNSVIREYERFLLQYTNQFAKLLREGLKTLVPALKDIAGEEILRIDSAYRMDTNIEKRLSSLFDKINLEMDLLFPTNVLERWALSMIGGVNRSNKKNMQKILVAAYRRSKKGHKSKEIPDFEPLMYDSKLSPYFRNIVDENIGLIKSIPQLKLPAFKNQMAALITRDANVVEITEAIQKYIKGPNAPKTPEGIYARARLIARDQVGKLNGALNKYRQQQLGGERYFWRSAGDRRCREQHKKLAAMSKSGKTFAWAKPPLSDPNTGRHCNPGEDYQCRCWAEMDMSDLLK